jgi:hypothetical protein
MNKTELEKENGILARELAEANRKLAECGVKLVVDQGAAKRLEAVAEEWREKCEEARKERDEKCNNCGLYKTVDDLKCTISAQEGRLERWEKFEKLLNEAGWDLEFGWG